MSELQAAIIAMCLMGIAFAYCIKLLFDAFVVHLRNQSELTTKAINQAGEAVALNGRVITALNALLAQRIEHEPSKLGVEGSNPSERTIIPKPGVHLPVVGGPPCPSCGFKLSERMRSPFAIEDSDGPVGNAQEPNR